MPLSVTRICEKFAGASAACLFRTTSGMAKRYFLPISTHKIIVTIAVSWTKSRVSRTAAFSPENSSQTAKRVKTALFRLCKNITTQINIKENESIFLVYIKQFCFDASASSLSIFVEDEAINRISKLDMYQYVESYLKTKAVWWINPRVSFGFSIVRLDR